MNKYIKLLAFLFLPMAFVACDEDEKLNSGEATVQFKEATTTISEVATSLNIPVVVSGEHTGLIKVRIEYKEAHDLKDDENVIITSRDLVIPAGTEEVVLETRLSVANEELESGRALNFEIVEVQGATVGTNKTCQVNLKEALPIEGSYQMTGLDVYTGSVGSLACVITLSETNADELLLDFGNGAAIPVAMAPGEKEGDYELTIPGQGDIGGGLALMYFDGGYVYNNDIAGYYDGETKVITIPELQTDLGLCIIDPATMSLYYAYLPYTDSKTGERIPVKFIKQ